MTKDEALQLAFDELEDVQFVDNTWQEAAISKAEAKEILRKLANRLTMRAAELGDSAASQALSTPKGLSDQQADTTPAPIR